MRASVILSLSVYGLAQLPPMPPPADPDGLQFRCVRESIQLGNSTLGALMVRGWPLLGGGTNQVERDDEGRPSLARYLDMEPWLEMTNPGCFEQLVNEVLFSFPRSTVRDSSDRPNPVSAEELFTLWDMWGMNRGSLPAQLQMLDWNLLDAYDYPGRGRAEMLALIAEQTLPLNDPALPPYRYNSTTFEVATFGFKNTFLTGCARLATPFVDALNALPLNFSFPEYTAFARRFGTRALAEATLGTTVTTYFNIRESVQLHISGAKYIGEACVDPAPQQLAYDSFDWSISRLERFITDDRIDKVLKHRIRLLSYHEAELIKYDNAHGPGAPAPRAQTLRG